jgi:hypothetical protein
MSFLYEDFAKHLNDQAKILLDRSDEVEKLRVRQRFGGKIGLGALKTLGIESFSCSTSSCIIKSFTNQIKSNTETDCCTAIGFALIPLTAPAASFVKGRNLLEKMSIILKMSHELDERLERDQQGNNTNFFLLIIFLFSTSSSN